jgi:cytochrome c-type biogenesis protein CcmH
MSISKILHNANFGLLLFTSALLKKIRIRTSHYSSFSAAQTQKSNRLKTSILKYYRYRIFFILLSSFAFLSTCSVWANSTYPLDSAKKEAQFNYLLKELRCLVCQNQDLADSNAELAKDLRAQVYQLVKDGKSDSEITDYLTARYGDFILFKPPVKAVTFLLWFGPFLFLLIGIVIFWRTCFLSREKKSELGTFTK